MSLKKFISGKKVTHIGCVRYDFWTWPWFISSFL